MLYPLIRKFFFALDAETAHGIGMHGVAFLDASGLAGCLTRPVTPCPVDVMGLKFPNPVGLAAGLDKNGAHIDGLARLDQASNLTNLPTSMLSQIEGNFSKMTSLMGEAERLAYNVQNIDQQFQPTYKNFAANKTSAQLVDGARQRWQESLDSYQHALKAGAVAVGNIQDTQSQTGSLVSASQSAVGMIQATQAGNQLIGVQTRQLAGLTVMLAAQGRADALEKSRKAAAQEQAREQFSRFMTGSSYSPTTVRMFHD